MTAAPLVADRSEAAVLLDVLIAPQAAFAALRERPRWLLAFVVTAVLGIVGSLLQIPAGLHVAAATFQANAANNPTIAEMSAAERQHMLGIALSTQHWTWIVYPILVFVGVTIAALVIAAINAMANGEIGFRRAFALAMNVAPLHFGIGYLVIGALAYLHGPQSFTTTRDVFGLLPSLAWFAPGAPPKLFAALAYVNVFEIWSFVLLGIGIGIVGKLARAVSYVVSFVVTFGGIAFVAPFAR
ncbi:MAG: hypothetical protein ACREM2_03795 [Vulcanimicrobiaceae bacterium]